MAADFSQSDVYTHTITGRMYLANPRFNIRAMARALSNAARFGGNTFWRYSVAQHSVLVSELMEYFQEGHPMEGLLHDGTEHIIADIPSPYKRLMSQYKELEHWLDAHIRKQYRLPDEPTAGMKHADSVALFIEANFLIEEGGKEETFAPGLTAAKADAEVLIRDGWRPYYMHENDAEQMFIDRYYELLTYDKENRPPLTFSVQGRIQGQACRTR